MDPLSILTIVGTVCAAWGGSQVAAAGTRDRLRLIEQKLDKHMEADVEVQRDIVDRLSRIEGMLDK